MCYTIRRLPARHPAGQRPPGLRRLRRVLPPAGRRADRAGPHPLPAARDDRAPPRADQVRSGLALILARPVQEGGDRRRARRPSSTRRSPTPELGPWLVLVAACYAFALQIYGDFSGYTDIARGSARLLGIELIHNFDQPYLSPNITDFWRRWHISLSTWLRDYLYIPLGGNRGRPATTYRNLMLTMLLGGLWHGAAWTFVVWGGAARPVPGAHRAFRQRPGEPATPPGRSVHLARRAPGDRRPSSSCSSPGSSSGPPASPRPSR